MTAHRNDQRFGADPSDAVPAGAEQIWDGGQQVKDGAQQVKDGAQQVKDGAEDARDSAETTARHSTTLRVLVAVGLVAYGLIHLMVTWIALQLAWGGPTPRPPDQKGALQELASLPAGSLVLWILAIGLFALVPWRVGLALWGFSWKRGIRRKLKRWGSIGQALVYGFLGVTALRVAVGSGSGSGRGTSAELMSSTLGRALLIAVAAGVTYLGFYLPFKGLWKRFTEELQDGGGPVLVRIGQVGFVAKGAALIIVGAMIGWGSISRTPGDALGLDAAFQAIKHQPYGPYLLTILAAGIACFGLYCFGWARRARRS